MDSIELDEVSWIILRGFVERGDLSLHDLSLLSKVDFMILSRYVTYLEDIAYLENAPAGPSGEQKNPIIKPLRITRRGEIAYENHMRRNKIEHIADIRAKITLVIAILALLLSLITFVWQVYTWRVTRVELKESQSTVETTTEERLP